MARRSPWLSAASGRRRGVLHRAVGKVLRTSPVKSGFGLRRYVAWALCALLRWSGSSWPESVPDAKPLTAILLIARDGLPDSNFADSVVLVMNNLCPAQVGILIHRPMAIPVSRLFPDLKRLAKVRDKGYFGGPVGLRA